MDVYVVLARGCGSPNGQERPVVVLTDEEKADQMCHRNNWDVRGYEHLRNACYYRYAKCTMSLEQD